MGKIVAQTTRKTRADATPEAALNAAVPEDLYIRLRVLSAQYRTPMKALVILALERFLANPGAPAKSPAA